VSNSAQLTANSNIWLGGVLALAGTVLGIVGSLASGYLERRNQRKRLLRQRYEEMTACIAATKTWLLHLIQCRTLDQVQQCPPVPEVRRLIVLSLLYFPEFKVKTTEYYNFLMEMYRLAVYLSATGSNTEWAVGAKMAKYRQESGRPSDELEKVSEALDDLIEKHAPEYTLA
jgi:hypothetical protein